MVTYVPTHGKKSTFPRYSSAKNLQVCHVMSCHDMDNSVVFPFMKYKYVISGLRHFKFAGEVEGGCVFTH